MVEMLLQRKIIRSYRKEIYTEIIRKSIHMTIALVPTLAAYSRSFTFFLLSAGIIFYTVSEYLRGKGYNVVYISQLTMAAERSRDKGKFVFGPITLGLGALSALIIYPYPAATIAIYALAFGDGLSSLIGKLFGSVKIPFTGGKTVIGSLTCFFSVFVIAGKFTDSLLYTFMIAIFATILEALPIKDFDNLLIPIGTGFFTSLLL